MPEISTKFDFTTEITIDGWYVTEFECHAILCADQTDIHFYWIDEVYVHADRWSRETSPPKRKTLERKITHADRLYFWVHEEINSEPLRVRADEAWQSFLSERRAEAA